MMSNCTWLTCVFFAQQRYVFQYQQNIRIFFVHYQGWWFILFTCGLLNVTYSCQESIPFEAKDTSMNTCACANTCVPEFTSAPFRTWLDKAGRKRQLAYTIEVTLWSVWKHVTRWFVVVFITVVCMLLNIRYTELYHFNEKKKHIYCQRINISNLSIFW